MSIVVLFVLLFFAGVFFYKCSRLHFMAPSFFVCAGFSLSAACCILNMQNWNTQIDIVTIGVIVLSVCIFGAGNLCGESVTFRAVHVKQFPVFDFSGNQRIRVKKLAIAAIESALIVINICYFRYIYQLSVIAGNRIGIAGMISYARHASNYLNTGYDMPVFVSQGIVLTKCIAYVFLFAFVYNLLNDRPKSRYFMLLLPCVSHSVNIVLSTARIGFIEFFVYIFFVTIVLLMKKKNVSLRMNRTFLKMAAGSLAAFLLIFTVLGYTTGKTQYLGALNAILLYIGGSVIAFHQYLHHRPPREFFGKETLRLFYAFLSKLGFDTPEYESYFLEFTNIGEHASTNVYTALRRYIQDYEFTGAVFVLFVLGFLYGHFFKLVIEGRKAGIALINTAAFAWPVFLFSIEEYALKNLLGISSLYQLFYTFVLYHLFMKPEVNDEKGK